MNKTIQASIANLWSEDRDLQNQAFFHVMRLTDKCVEWAYDVWGQMVENLTHKDNHNRAIAAQVLCNLARSDPKNRILKNIDALIAVTRDERFVTARHCMQSLWKVGVAGKKQQIKYMEGLERRFQECASERNCTLIRYDILQSLRNVYSQAKDEKIREKALALIETEKDAKYRKKYATLWKSV
jgi:hypothetical protein